MIENLTECAESAIKNDQTHVGKYPISEVIDMIKDLSEAEYHCKITKAMAEEEKEEEEEEKYLLRQMKEEYGDEDGKRYYDEWRYSNGRFAPRGRGTRRGYEEPRYHMPIEYMYPSAYYRDMDRTDGRMYYSGDTGTSSDSTNSSMGNTRGYSDGYSDGYSEGQRTNRRDSREGRSGMSRRSYMESKELHSDNTQESKQAKMKELEKYMNELSSDMTDMINGASNEEKTMLKQKLQNLSNKIV